MKILNATNEVFALRDGERVTVTAERGASGVRFLAVMARSVEMPEGPRSPVRQTDGAPVEQAAIVACRLDREGRWQWVQLSPPTKENLGDLLFDGGAEKDRWYFVTVE